MTRKTDTKTLFKAMRILARDIQSDDGVANGAISEAADRIEELQAQRDRLREVLKELVFLIDHNQYFYDEEPTEMKRARKALQEDRDE